MKKLLVIGLIIFQSITSCAQNNAHKISFELRYPVPFGDNFINNAYDNGYSGLIDIGIDYNIIEKNGLGIGILLNSSFLKLSETDVSLIILSPKIKIDYEYKVDQFSIIPQIGLGYSNWQFRIPAYNLTDADGNPLEGEDQVKYRNGLTIKGGAKFVFNSNKRLDFYFQIAYEFTKLDKPDNGASNSANNRNIHLFYPGVGVSWKF